MATHAHATDRTDQAPAHDPERARLNLNLMIAARGWSIAELGRRAGWRATGTTHRHANGSTPLTVHHVDRYAAALGVRPADFYAAPPLVAVPIGQLFADIQRIAS